MSWTNEAWLVARLGDGYLPGANAFIEGDELSGVVIAIGDDRKDGKIAANDGSQHFEGRLLVRACRGRKSRKAGGARADGGGLRARCDGRLRGCVT